MQRYYFFLKKERNKGKKIPFPQALSNPAIELFCNFKYDNGAEDNYL